MFQTDFGVLQQLLLKPIFLNISFKLLNHSLVCIYFSFVDCPSSWLQWPWINIVSWINLSSCLLSFFLKISPENNITWFLYLKHKALVQIMIESWLRYMWRHICCAFMWMLSRLNGVLYSTTLFTVMLSFQLSSCIIVFSWNKRIYY